MNLPLLHRRLTVAMSFSALLAFVAGAGWTFSALLTAAALGTAFFWQPSPEASVRWEQVARAIAVAMFSYVVYQVFFVFEDTLGPILWLVLFLLGSEALRTLEARNDLRLYGLSFALLIAATAYRVGVMFAVGFIAFIGLATVALMVGHLRRQAEHFRVAQIPIGRPFLSATAALSGVTLLMSALVFVTFPRLPRTWSGPRLAAAERVMAGFGSEVSLAEFGTRIGANPAVVFRVEFPDGIPENLGALHWRGRAFDYFSGVRWRRTPILPLSGIGPQQYVAQWGSSVVRQRIYGGPPGAKVLFGLHPIVGLQTRPGMRPFPDPAGDVLYFGSDDPVYTVTSVATLPSAERLRAAPELRSDADRPYLQLPRLDPRFLALADSLTRGEPSRFDKARAVERYLQSQFTYTLELPARRNQTGLAYFLFDRKQGHCEYFSSAMVVLLRAVGIPARNVNGFLGGNWNAQGGYLAVTQNDAHSWAEVWFPELGWVAFDPTPSTTREATVQGAEDSFIWPTLFWLDGVQHRWQKWVLDYDLEKQIRMLSKVGDAFSPDRDTQLGSRRVPLRQTIGVVLTAAGLAVGLWWALRGRGPRRRLTDETRLYLALRRTYERAGLRGALTDTPLALLERLRVERAPGTEAAERLIRTYLRARFADQDPGDAGREAMRTDLAEVRASVRRRLAQKRAA